MVIIQKFGHFFSANRIYPTFDIECKVKQEKNESGIAFIDENFIKVNTNFVCHALDFMLSRWQLDIVVTALNWKYWASVLNDSKQESGKCWWCILASVHIYDQVMFPCIPHIPRSPSVSTYSVYIDSCYRQPQSAPQASVPHPFSYSSHPTTSPHPLPTNNPNPSPSLAALHCWPACWLSTRGSL